MNYFQHSIRVQSSRGCAAGLLLVPMVLLFWLNTSALGQVEPVSVRVPNEKAWVGQRVPFFVELRANGSFAGSSNFELPQLPGAIVIKIGSPVVSSEQIEGESWFVQSHEFALYSQRPGLLKVPKFAVRFASRKGFVGEASDRRESVPEWEVEIQRPPDTENVGFLITTESFDVQESWDPAPGPSQAGDILKRTIVQQASQLSGMALVPASTKAPEGIRVYANDAETKDELERGEFLGTRTETITYLLAKPGAFTLPSVTYVWWNPKTNKLLSKTLPEVTFDVAPAPAEAETEIGTESSPRWWLWASLLTVAILVAIVASQWKQMIAWLRITWSRLNPPDRVAARALIRACKEHNVSAAETAWITWRNTQRDESQLGPDLQNAVQELDRQLYGLPSKQKWNGDRLLQVFQAYLSSTGKHVHSDPNSVLPRLNP